MADFTREVIFNPKRCDKRSFRTITMGRGRLRVICCLNNEDGTSNWDPNRAIFAGGRVVKGVCNTKTVTQSILKPKRRGRAGGTSMARKAMKGLTARNIKDALEVAEVSVCSKLLSAERRVSCRAGLRSVESTLKFWKPTLEGKKRGAKKRRKK